MKEVGETPLQATERLRTFHSIPKDVPLAYAGRLDPMASGLLLVLIGDECKRQEHYHTLDKAYDFEVLLGIGSDTHDVLGIVHAKTPVHPTHGEIRTALIPFIGEVTLPYPHFSAKTVQGKPLHMWTLEKRLHEIDVPTRTSRVYSLRILHEREEDIADIVRTVRESIARIPTVTDPRKALGRDFRRNEVLASWEQIQKAFPHTRFTILTLRAVASSGTYMRTLASCIGEKLGTTALAYSIHRTKIGRYVPLPLIGGVWVKKY